MLFLLETQRDMGTNEMERVFESPAHKALSVLAAKCKGLRVPVEFKEGVWRERAFETARERRRAAPKRHKMEEMHSQTIVD